MYIETSRDNYQKLKQYLIEQGIYFESSDCTLPNEKIQMIHIEFADGLELSNEQKNTINNIIDQAINKVISQSDRAKLLSANEDPLRDTDGDGLSDKLEIILDNEGNIPEHKHKSWNDQLHTPMQEAIGWFTGEADKEERE